MVGNHRWARRVVRRVVGDPAWPRQRQFANPLAMGFQWLVRELTIQFC